MFQSPATIEQVATRVDGTLKITVSTQELQAQEMTELFKLKGKIGWLLFKENEIVKEDVPEEQAPEFSKKVSPFEELNKALYVYWSQATSKGEPYNEFLRRWAGNKKREILENLPK